MSSKKKKWYVVWVGKRPGVYSSWDECLNQTKGYPGAKYKSFTDLGAATAASKESWEMFYTSSGTKSSSANVVMMHNFKEDIVKNSICVDAACSGNPGKMEYRGVDTWSKEELFRSAVYPRGTNNIGEFLALAHALAVYSEKQPDLTIYSDSRIAIGWVERGVMKTKLPENSRTAKLWSVIRKAENWLATHDWDNPIMKWETKVWGEIPADFGRK